jgi:hypothetical protein
MTITLDVQGADAIRGMLQRMTAEAEARVARVVTETALIVDTDIKTRIQRGPKSGKVRRRGSITHQASAPGEAPATDTGTLVSSVVFEQTKRLEATVASRLAYAYYLEFGTQRIRPRPAWVPAVEKARPDFVRKVAEAIAGAAR